MLEIENPPFRWRQVFKRPPGAMFHFKAVFFRALQHALIRCTSITLDTWSEGGKYHGLLPCLLPHRVRIIFRIQPGNLLCRPARPHSERMFTFFLTQLYLYVCLCSAHTCSEIGTCSIECRQQSRHFQAQRTGGVRRRRNRFKNYNKATSMDHTEIYGCERYWAKECIHINKSKWWQ